MTGPTTPPADDEWAARRRDGAAEQAARLQRAKDSESTRARTLLADFVRTAQERGIATTELKARALNGRSLYRTGLTGWYLRRNATIAVDEQGEFYVMTAPTSIVSRLHGVTLTPSDPPMIPGAGGRDGESMPLPEMLALRLAAAEAGESWTR